MSKQWTCEGSAEFSYSYRTDGITIPLESLRNKQPESKIAPAGRNFRNIPIASPEKNKPDGKPLDEAFEVTNIPWEITCKGLVSGVATNHVFASGDRERNFRKEFKNFVVFS